MPSDPAFEREKWVADIDFRKRELALKERELDMKEREHQASTWRSPLIVAILAAAVAAAGNAIVASVNGKLQRELEGSKAESARILEMIKTGDAEGAAANLGFLLDAGLIADQTLSEKVQKFLKNRRPGAGPALPAPSSRVGFEQSNLLTGPLQKTLEARLTRYFAYLDHIGFPSPNSAVTVSIQSLERPNAYYLSTKNTIVIDERLAADPSVSLREYNHHILGTKWSAANFVGSASIESGLADYFACSFLDNPEIGETSGRLFSLETRYIRTLKNAKTYHSEPADLANAPLYGEVWGGFFWDIRAAIGQDAADSLIASVWISFSPQTSATAPEPAFVAALFSSAKARGAKVLQAVQSSADARKIPHP